MILDKFRLDGKIALVTGGTRGIGLGISRALAEAGAHVIMAATADRPDVVDAFRADGLSAECMTGDLLDSSAPDRLVADCLARHGRLDILVNNAGINKISPFAEINTADFERIQRVNVLAPMILCRAVLPGMRGKGWGRIVNVSSIWGKISKEQRAPYSTSKFGIDGMTVALAAEAAGDGVLANSVAPGFIDTELTQRVLGPDGIAELTAKVPVGRLGRPEEIATFISWLAGPENTYISGQNIAIDGGFTRV